MTLNYLGLYLCHLLMIILPLHWMDARIRNNVCRMSDTCTPITAVVIVIILIANRANPWHFSVCFRELWSEEMRLNWESQKPVR